MQTAVTVAPRRRGSLRSLLAQTRIEAPTLTDVGVALFTSLLLVLSFPDFNLWPLAWIAVTPLLFAVARRPSPSRAFAMGWITGTVFFYGSCYWLTYSMIHFGGLNTVVAYLLLVPGALVLGLFPAMFAMVLALAFRRWNNKAIFLAPVIWTATEWARLGVTGQLWNAIGYSQSYEPALIQAARWGGVYMVGFLMITVSSAVTFALLNRCKRALIISATCLFGIAMLIAIAYATRVDSHESSTTPDLLVVAIQPNVPMNPSQAAAHMRELIEMHLSESAKALQQLPKDRPRLVIWPESPMNFAYGTDPELQSRLADFTRENHTALLFNSQEPAPGNGLYNSAILINEEGKRISQYDKIRLLPFGEYVPLPHWLPGSSLITALVGDFAAGDKYTLLQIGPVKAGVFICIESAYPSIARTFASEGADVLINISNDGYLGPTAVMRQHLANAIFRAVENGRTLLRVTNSGISAFITSTGQVKDETGSFQTATRIWTISGTQSVPSFYTKHGDWFVLICSIVSLMVLTSLIVPKAVNRRYE